MARSRFETVENKTVQVKQGFYRGMDLAIRKACFDLEALAKRNVRDQDAIDTGALRASIYVNTSKKSNYAIRASEAATAASTTGKHSGKPSVGFKMFPEERVGAVEGVVAVGAEYAHLVEFGTVHTPPRAFFNPAARDVFAEFDKVVVDMVNKELDKI